MSVTPSSKAASGANANTMTMSLSETCTCNWHRHARWLHETMAVQGAAAKADHAGDVFPARLRVSQARKHILEENNSQRGHGKWLMSQFTTSVIHRPLGFFTDIFRATKSTLTIMGVDHHPDEDGHHQVYTGILQAGDRLEQRRQNAAGHDPPAMQSATHSDR